MLDCSFPQTPGYNRVFVICSELTRLPGELGVINGIAHFGHENRLPQGAANKMEKRA